MALTTSFGQTPLKVVSSAGTNANVTSLITSGKLWGWDFANTTAAWKYVRVYDIAVTPTVGASSKFTIPVPPNGKATLSGGAIELFAGLGYTITGAAADNDTTTVAANDVIGVFFANPVQ